MRQRLARLPLAGGLAGILVAALMLLLPAPVETAREAATDVLMRVVPRPAEDTPVLAVAVGEEDLVAMGPWPWPRAQWAELVTRLAEAGALAVVLDIAFVAPAPGDAALAAALAQAPAVTGLVAGTGGPSAGYGVAVLGDPAVDDLPELAGLAPLAVGGAAGAALALPGAPVRAVPLLLRLAQDGSRTAATGLLPGLALAAVARAVQADTLLLRREPEGRTVQLGEVALLPLPAGGMLRLHPAAGRVPVLGAARLLREHGLAAAASGRVVVIGATAAAAAPLRPSLFGPYTPSLLIQAEAVSQLAAGWVPLRPPGGAAGEALAALLLALLAGLAVRLRTGPGLAIAALLALSWLGAAAAALRFGPVLLDPLWPAIGVLAGGAAEIGRTALRAARERARLAARFVHRLPPGIAAALLALPEEERLRPERRRVAVVITDLADFTLLVHTADPARLVPLLNAYLAGIEAAVTAEGGTLERLIGDSVLAVFGAPVPQPDHAARALRAARAIDRFGEAFRARPEAAAIGWGVTRIGLAAGDVLVGELGGTRLTWTVCGDAANAASRLQTMAKAFGLRGLAAGIEDASLAPAVAQVELRGLAQDVPVHPIEAPARDRP